jgi:hypothetical protein
MRFVLFFSTSNVIFSRETENEMLRLNLVQLDWLTSARKYYLERRWREMCSQKGLEGNQLLRIRVPDIF